MTRVPPERVRAAKDAPIRSDGRHVLYWMIAARRPRWNFALQRAVELSAEHGRPLLVLEALRVDYPHASDRFHRFVLDGMQANARVFAEADVRYHPYVEPEKGAGRGLLEALAARATVVVTDACPTFFLPRMVAAAAKKIDVRLEVVDSLGLLPLAATERAWPTAYAFRRLLQRKLPDHLEAMPRANPLARRRRVGRATIGRDVLRRWPRAAKALLGGKTEALAALPVDHTVAPTRLEGGAIAGRRRLLRVVKRSLPRYATDRNHPDLEATSGLARRFAAMRPIRARRPMSSRPWSTPAPTTRSGMRPRRSSSARAGSTTTCGCSGGSGFSSGRRTPRWPSPR